MHTKPGALCLRTPISAAMTGINGTPSQKRRRVSNAGGSALKSTTKQAATPASEPVVDSRFAMGADFEEEEEEEAVLPSGATLHSLSREPTSGSTEQGASAPADSSPAKLIPLASSTRSPLKSSPLPAAAVAEQDSEDEDGKDAGTDTQLEQTVSGAAADADASKRLRKGSKKQVLSEAKLKRMQMIHDRYGDSILTGRESHTKQLEPSRGVFFRTQCQSNAQDIGLASKTSPFL